jgi:nickel/cobalt transporter (NicO) family protein
VALRATAATMSLVTSTVEIASFAAVTALGTALTWRKAGKFLGLSALSRDRAPEHAPDCEHVHFPPPAEIDRMTRLREMAGVVLAAGIRPCAGAILVLVFAL